MPAGISSLPPSSFDYDKKNLPAFTIIPRDNYGTTLPILHLNNFTNDDDDNETNHHRDSDNNESISNKITKNERNNLYSRKRISKSNDHLVLANLQSHQANPLKKNNKQSKSHDQLDNGDEKRSRKELSSSAATTIAMTATTKSAMNLSTEDFKEVLTAKLKRVQEQELDNHHEQQSRRGKLKPQIQLKKPFITTVKTGEFLMPPPEVAAILGMAPNGDFIGHDVVDSTNQNQSLPRSKFRPLVSLNRRPEVRHSSHNARCQAALKATVDFAVNIVNSSNATTTSTFASAAQRLASNNSINNNSNNNRFVENGLPANTMTPRAYPKKLQPIEGTMHIMMSYGDQSLPFSNIMFDRRVVRGSTIASASILADEQSQAARHADARRKQMSKKRCQTQASRSMMLRMSSPPPVPGRKHEPVQTELYLEELSEKPQESEVATQTDYFMDRPSTPPFIPEKTGIDVETQIEPGDLFDYDIEVQPVLENLVGKTIEQAFKEVLEEEELAAIKEQQRRFLELRAAEKAEALRLEEQDRRLREEKDRRVKQHEEALKTQQETEERVAAAVLLTGYIAELLPTVLDGLNVSGYLLDEMKSDSEDGFMPWLVKEVRKEMDTMVDSRELLEDIIREILEKRAEIYRKLGEDYDASRSPMTSERVDDVASNIDELEQNVDGDAEYNDEYSTVVAENSDNV